MVTHTSTDNVLIPPNESNFRELIRFIRPSTEESRWREVPWQNDIRDACHLAIETGRPIFLWAMNGNPFGCT